MISYRWFPPDEWKQLQSVIPITCVDVLPVRYSKKGREAGVPDVGLIFRDTPHQGGRWCLIGGRLCYGESLRGALRRQVRETLGKKVRPVLETREMPLVVAEYAPSGRSPFALDPRQHSVGLTYAVEIRGLPVPTGEAIRFRWFEIEGLPSRGDFGFDQDRVVAACIKRLLNCGT
jgi:ADP-ribose pyrophosphatase YjhB (NUDIX family)